jgi:hypothetical protein
MLMASRKLRHYFQAYHIIVPSSQPLKDIMRNREATGRIGKWAMELNEFTIDYIHRSSIQSQALADFIADWTPGDEDITMSTTTPAAPPHQAPLPSLAGPITRARARDLNFVMLLKNEGPEE